MHNDDPALKARVRAHWDREPCGTRGLEEPDPRVLAEGHPEAPLTVADAEHLPFAAASFDLVYSYGVLHHSPDTAAAIAEVLRVLRPAARRA